MEFTREERLVLKDLVKKHQDDAIKGTLHPEDDFNDKMVCLCESILYKLDQMSIVHLSEQVDD